MEFAISKSRFGTPEIDHLKFSEVDNNIFILSFSYPIISARLVMVDECILRIDYFINQKKENAFIRTFNKDLLKCDKWAKKIVENKEGLVTYTF